ncbi:MAG: GntR family transcriptional regulator [Rhodoglobus sp.]
MSTPPQSSAEIYEQFRGLITSGELGAGERLPTVRQVARDLGVALGTAARAYKMLESDHLVVSRTGAGTTVAADSARLSKDAVVQIRKLVASARANDDSLDDVISAVRTAWR